MNTLETIIDSVKEHNATHPEHGVGCICMDEHVRNIRRLMYDKGLAHLDNQKAKQQVLKILKKVDL